MIDTYDAPEELKELATSVTSVVCLCDQEAIVNLESIALGLDDGMMIGFDEPAVMAAIRIVAGVKSKPEWFVDVLNIAKRLGCGTTPEAVHLVATTALKHVTHQRELIRTESVSEAPHVVTGTAHGVDKTSLEWLVAQMEKAESSRVAVDSAS